MEVKGDFFVDYSMLQAFFEHDPFHAVESGIALFVEIDRLFSVGCPMLQAFF
jgi:hypothetical protein